MLKLAATRQRAAHDLADFTDEVEQRLIIEMLLPERGVGIDRRAVGRFGEVGALNEKIDLSGQHLMRNLLARLKTGVQFRCGCGQPFALSSA